MHFREGCGLLEPLRECIVQPKFIGTQQAVDTNTVLTLQLAAGGGQATRFVSID